MSRKIYSTSFWMKAFVDHLLFLVNKNKLESTTSLIEIKKNYLNYYCKFSIAYTDKFVTWEMNFNAQYPELGPDLTLKEEEFWRYETVEKLASNLPSLTKWNSLNNYSLYEVLNNLLCLFKEYEIKLLEVNSKKLFQEYSLMKNKSIIKDLEFYHIEGSKVRKVHISLNLVLAIPSLQFLENTRQINILMFIDYNSSSTKMISSKLYLPGYLENIFDETEISAALPLNDKQYIAEYVERIGNFISDKVNILLHDLENRKHFIANIITMQYSSVLEYDIVFFRHIRLLINYSNLNFVLTIQLPPYFPNDRFSMTLQSIYHMTNQGKPAQMILQDLRYNLHWDMKRIILEMFILVIVECFNQSKKRHQKSKILI